MFLDLFDLRLSIVDTLNALPDDEADTTAAAWIDLLELEATRLSHGADWLPASAGTTTLLRRRHAQRWGRVLGQADARLGVIVADQVVACLLRGQLAGVDRP